MGTREGERGRKGEGECGWRRTGGPKKGRPRSKFEIQGGGRTEEMAEEGVCGANSDVTSPWRCNANANETRGERGCVGSVVMEESI